MLYIKGGIMELITGKYTSLGNGIQVRKNGNDTYTYYFNFRDNNKEVKRVKLFVSDKHTPKNFKTAILQSMNAKSGNLVVKQKISLNDLAEHYFKSRYTKKRITLKQEYNSLSSIEFENSKIVKRRLASVKTEQQKYNKNVSDSNIAKLDISKITKQDIKDYTDTYLPIKNLSKKSAFGIVSLIKTIFNYAVRNELIEVSNPFQNTVFKNPKRKRIRYLNGKELTLLLNTCKEYESNPNVYLVVYLAVLTAARAQTILNIKKKDIDLKNKHIRLSNFKADKSYTIRLNQESIEWLNKKVLQHIEYNDYLIQPAHKRYIKNPQQPLSEVPEKIYEIMDDLFNQHLDKSNNSDRDYVVNFHTIRRSVATNLALQGANIYDIMILLNHSSTKQTQDYLNLDNDSLSAETDKFFASIFKRKYNFPDIPF